MAISFRKYLSFLVGLLVIFAFSFKVIITSVAYAKDTTSITASEKNTADEDQDFDLDKKLDSSLKIKMFPDEWNHPHEMHVLAFFASNFVKSYYKYLNVHCSAPIMNIETPPPNFSI